MTTDASTDTSADTSADTSTGEAPLFELPQRYVDLQAEARTLAVACEDVADRADEADRFDPDVRERLTKSGLCEVVVAAEHGGRFDQVDSLAVTVVREALASVSAHLDSMFAMQLHGGNGYSEEYGIERLHRDSHGWAIAGGTPAIQRVRITSELLGRPFSQRPPEAIAR